MLQKGWKEKQHFIWKEVKMPPQLPTMCCWYSTQGEMTQSLHHYKFFRTLHFLFISLGERDHLWRAGLSIEHLIITWGFYSKAKGGYAQENEFLPTKHSLFNLWNIICTVDCFWKNHWQSAQSLTVTSLETKSWSEHLKSTSSAQSQGGSCTLTIGSLTIVPQNGPEMSRLNILPPSH